MAGAALAQTQAAAPTLYKRLGGYDAIAAVSDDFIGRLASDKSLNRFLVGLSDASKAHLRQMVVDQLCAATGGPCLYLGRDMKTAHKDFHITEKEWQALLVDFRASLAKFQVPRAEQKELIDIVESTKADMVTASAPKKPSGQAKVRRAHRSSHRRQFGRFEADFSAKPENK
jgi:hemoglobin